MGNITHHTHRPLPSIHLLSHSLIHPSSPFFPPVPTLPQHYSADFKQNKESVLSVLVDKVTNVNVVVPEAWGVCTKY